MACIRYKTYSLLWFETLEDRRKILNSNFLGFFYIGSLICPNGSNQNLWLVHRTLVISLLSPFHCPDNEIQQDWDKFGIFSRSTRRVISHFWYDLATFLWMSIFLSLLRFDIKHITHLLVASHSCRGGKFLRSSSGRISNLSCLKKLLSSRQMACVHGQDDWSRMETNGSRQGDM